MRWLVLSILLLLLGAVARATSAAEVWVGNQRSNTIQIIDSNSFAIIAEIRAGQKPHNVTFDSGRHRAYVANVRSGDFTVIDADTRRVIQTVAAGKIAHHVAVSPDDRRLVVALRGENRVIVYDAATLRQVKAIPVGIGERAAGDPPGRLSGSTPGIAAVDLSQRKLVHRIPLRGDPLSVAVRP